MKNLTDKLIKDSLKENQSFSESSIFTEKPCIVDFYADWCGPCKMMTPILENIQTEYGETLNIFKVDIENETGLSQTFSIRNIPTLLFVSKDGNKKIEVGVKDMATLKGIISDHLGL